MKKMEAMKTFFERDDAISPGGGQKVQNRELLDLKKADDDSYDELAELSAAELGVELD